MQRVNVSDERFKAALGCAYGLAVSARPDERDRIDRSVKIIEDEDIIGYDDFKCWYIRSNKEEPFGTHVYRVSTSCTCQDFIHNAPEGRCKHRYAVTLYLKAIKLLAGETIRYTATWKGKDEVSSRSGVVGTLQGKSKLWFTPEEGIIEGFDVEYDDIVLHRNLDKIEEKVESEET